MKGIPPRYIIEYKSNVLPINDRWVKQGWLYVVKSCKRFLFWYRIEFERGVFEEGEF